MKRFLLLLPLLILGCLSASSQRLVGRVLDAKTGEATPFVNVFYDGAKNAVQTDAEGRFSIPFRKGENSSSQALAIKHRVCIQNQPPTRCLSNCAPST